MIHARSLAVRGTSITRRRLLASGMIGMGAVLAGCSAGQSGSAPGQAGGAPPPPLNGRSRSTLVVAVDAAVEDLDPATNLDWAFGLAPVYDTLVGLVGTSPFKTGPQLARSLTSNPDFTTWLCKLRPGVRFQDGTVCDAAAVKAAITRTIDLPGGIGYLWYITNPGSQIVVVDPLTIRFELGSPRPFFNNELAQEYGFYIASPAAAAAHSTRPQRSRAWLAAIPPGRHRAVPAAVAARRPAGHLRP